MTTTAVILAGGAGVRSGLDYPKQFLRLGGLPVLEHTLAAFDRHPHVDETLVIASQDWLEETRELVDGVATTKPHAVTVGGVTRNDSTRAALDWLTAQGRSDDCRLLIHDGVRPLVDGATIDRCLAALETYGAVDTVIEASDTVVVVDGDKLVEIPDRARLRRGQTPQAFRLRVLRDAYAGITAEDLQHITDDCAVVLRALPGLDVGVVAGAHENLKITRPVDIYLADRLLQGRQVRVSQLAAAAPVAAGCWVVIGGTSGIGGAIARRLAQQRRVVAMSRRSTGTDVRDEQSVTRSLARARAEYGPIVGVVNAAGTLSRGDLVSASPDQVREQVEVNLVGALHVARAAYEHLRETRGHLLLFTSSSYTRGRAGYAAYSASKAAVVNLTQSLADEWFPVGIKVNCVNPARTDTPMRQRAFGVEPPDTLLSVDRVADASLQVLASAATGHVFDVRLEEASIPKT
ncbi:MAG TPA: D-ribitol-5-phosphate cytidylyltransferase [Mycobacteriales bacterium]|nr:D-ribitol-5-phosphate cytidylyltransferase [Mycobacteriales bacterium]